MKYVLLLVALLFQETGHDPGELRELDLAEGVTIRMIWVPPGTFMMGSPPGEEGRSFSYRSNPDESDLPTFDPERQYEVQLTRGVWLGETEVTQLQWRKLMGKTPSQASGDDLPVETVSWLDVQEFLEAVNAEVDGGRFRLPTEAEWEYAARAGKPGRYAGDLDELAWHRGTSGRRTHPVGTKAPNAWGLHDMHGNVTEWCADLYGPYPEGSVEDPRGATPEQSASKDNGRLSNRRLARGGSFTGRSLHCRSADRGAAPSDSRDFYCGFRLVWADER